jgi:hypothetical protein
MPVCTKCGTWNQDAATKCDKCGAALSAVAAAPVTTVVAQTGSSGASKRGFANGFAEWRRKQGTLLSVVLVAAMVAGVLLVKSAITKYDSSGQCTLDSNYSVETKTKDGVTENVDYLVTYTFAVQGVQYTGKDKVYSEPTVADAAVYYMAKNPRENSLSPGRLIDFNLGAAGVAFLIGFVAYGMMPKEIGRRTGAAVRAGVEGIGDSGNEPARMKRGKYSALTFVHFSFFVEAALIALVVGLAATEVPHADPTSYLILGIATVLGMTVTLWIYADRWYCIEAFSSRFCSGLANISLFYVPVVAFVYANYRGLKKLAGR